MKNQGGVTPLVMIVIFLNLFLKLWNKRINLRKIVQRFF